MRARSAIVALALLASSVARADPETDCLASFEAAQLRRAEGKLLEARESLEVCGAATCPEVVQRKCGEWLIEVEDSIPHLIVAGVEGAAPLVDARIVLDGVVVADRIDGAALEVDPGPHRVRIEHPDGRSAEREIDLAEGTRRVVTLVLPPIPTPPQPPPPKPVAPVKPDATHEPATRASLMPLVGLGYGVAGAGLVAGIITGVLALERADDLSIRCQAPGPEACTQGEIDAALALAHASTATLALAGVGLVVGSVALGVSLSEEDDIALVPADGTLFGLGLRLRH